MTELIFIACGLVLGVGGVFGLRRILGGRAPTNATVINSVIEKVREVGRLVALEVQAKEIATSTKGWSWLPPIVLSQARIAMIFHFEKQYTVDLTRIGESEVEEIVDGRYRVHLPPIEGMLRLRDVSPYDIQAGRILGLIDVIQMNAETQKALMTAAQDKAAGVFEESEANYVEEARRSVERQLKAILGLFSVEIECVWANDQQRAAPTKRIELKRKPAIAGFAARELALTA